MSYGSGDFLHTIAGALPVGARKIRSSTLQTKTTILRGGRFRLQFFEINQF